MNCQRILSNVSDKPFSFFLFSEATHNPLQLPITENQSGGN